MDEIEALLICNSNMFIPVVLTEVLQNKDHQYIVISDTDNIRMVFEMLAIPNVIYYHYGFIPQRDGRFGFVKEKKKLYNFVNRYKISRIVFFTQVLVQWQTG